MDIDYLARLCDLLIAIAYFSIPLEILYYMWKIRITIQIRHKVVGILFIVFIATCGISHLCQFVGVRITTTFASKLCTAVVSIITAMVLIRVIPQTIMGPMNMADVEHNLREQLDDLQESDLQTKTAIRTRSVFMQFLCHELRNPLFNVTSNTDFLLESKLTHEQEDLVKSINISSELMTSIVNDVLDISALEAGRLQFESKAIDLWWVCQSTVQQSRTRASAKDIILTLDIKPDVRKYVFSDPVRLHQILLNLISNAIKFTKKGKVEVRVWVVATNADSSEIAIEVEDTGIGIERSRLGDLFTPYTQTSSGDYQEGSGLGLAITKNIVDILGGAITVRSVIGSGTKFTVRIPFKHATKREVVRSAQTPIHAVQVATHHRLLVTEDNMVNRKLILRMLDSLGISADTANDGQECVDKITMDCSYNMILMDIQMPRKNGFDASCEVRKLGYTGPIIALTANAQNADREKAKEAQMDDFMTKPVSKKELAKMLRKYLVGWSPLQATSPVTPTRFAFLRTPSPSNSTPSSRVQSPHSAITLPLRLEEPLLKKDDLA